MENDAEPKAGSLFPATRWTLIRSLRGSEKDRREALETLLRAYWQPLYVFVRKTGVSSDEAQDAVQEVLALLLSRDFFQQARPERGRFRSFLLVAVKNALINRHAAAVTQRRGAGIIPLELDAELAERLVSETTGAPDEAFDKEWASQVLEHALARLRQEFEAGERKGPFDLVSQFFVLEGTPSYKDIAKQYGMTLPQLKSFLHRARSRFRELVREEIAQTVETEGELEAELSYLIAVLRK